MPFSIGPPSVSAMPELDEAALRPTSRKRSPPKPGSAVETASVLHRVDKQLMAAQEDDPWGTGLAVQDQPAVQVKRRHCAAHRCHWSGNAGPACSAGEEAVLCCMPLSLVR
jgi:hypothetical protein